MIEKLNVTYIQVESDGNAKLELANKINELVDAVNKIMTWRFETDEDSDWYDDPKHREQPVDPYEEQRKWIGKLCRCWDSDINDDTWGILQDIKDNKTEKYYLYGIGYEHCEPVKPDDDIIYKGGDNE